MVERVEVGVGFAGGKGGGYGGRRVSQDRAVDVICRHGLAIRF